MTSFSETSFSIALASFVTVAYLKSRRRSCFAEKSVLKNIQETFVPESLFNNVAGLRSAHRCFSVEMFPLKFAKF